MDQFLQMYIFFFISSVGFVVLFVFVSVLLFYSIRAARTFSEILDKVDKSVDEIGDTTKDIIEDMRDSFLFNLIFKKKRRSRKD